MEALIPIVLVIGTILSYTILVFLFSVFLKNNGVADIGYGFGFVVATWVLFLRKGIPSFDNWVLWLLVLLVTVWGIRLSAHLALRSWKQPEDWRYQVWRQRWSVVSSLYFYVRSFVQIYLLQALLTYLVFVPVMHLLVTPIRDIHVGFYVGVVLVLFGILFETVADIQLYRFKKKSSERMLFTRGLFAYSRRPNYFGEVCVWWGFFLMATISGGWMLTVMSPIAVTYILYAIAGVMVDEHISDLDSFETYKKNTQYFIPGLARKAE